MSSQVDNNYDIIIIGGGVAALSAGIYTGRDNFRTLILEGTVVSSTDYPGGALMLTSSIENFPGYLEGSGMDLVLSIREQAEKFGAVILEERATELDVALKPGDLHRVIATNGETYTAKAVIIATGAVARRLGVPGEDALFGTGVSTCATCDGWAFNNKTIAVVGGGDTAVEDALLLAKNNNVKLLVRGHELRATGPEAREIIHNPNVEILYNTVVNEILADETGTKVGKITTTQNNTQTTWNCDGVFIAIGSDPATGFLYNSVIQKDLQGYIVTVDGSTRVAGGIPGVFAAGDVNAQQKLFRQAITSAGNAVQAALEARMYLNQN